jgi:DNA-binding response OmpR family regulator
VVEDEADIREAMIDAMTEAGFSVLTAKDGEEGLALAKAEHPDLILLDLVMPIMDGHEMLRRLRQDPWGQTARVIVLTSMDDVSNVASAHTGSITDYIIKAHTSLEDLVKQVRISLYSK